MVSYVLFDYVEISIHAFDMYRYISIGIDISTDIDLYLYIWSNIA